mgnify:CR=1 FL=1
MEVWDDASPKAKRVIFLFMAGGVSHVDSYDYKEKLFQDDGKMIRFDDARTLAKTRKIVEHRVMKPLWSFDQYGQTGQHVSELFPHTARHVDDLCFLKGMHTEGVAHGPSTLFLHTGSINLIRPSMGSWTNYGLGTENNNLPGFVSIGPAMGNGGPPWKTSALVLVGGQGPHGIWPSIFSICEEDLERTYPRKLFYNFSSSIFFDFWRRCAARRQKSEKMLSFRFAFFSIFGGGAQHAAKNQKKC